MKCAVCGKEFGYGTNCQNCGVDRVTGLANYRGYSSTNNDANQRYNISQDNSSYNGGYSFPKTMVCYACSEIIPSDSEYCPHCRKKLYETCPKCGARYSSQFQVCNKCGTDRTQYNLVLEVERQEAIKREREERYKREAQELRNNFNPSIASILALPLTAWILFCLTPLYPFGGYGSLLVIIGVSILLWIITKEVFVWPHGHMKNLLYGGLS